MIIHVDKLLEYNIDKKYSIFESSIINLIYGEDVNKIKIWMNGYETDKEAVEIRDNPFLKIGEEFLIFASKNKDGTYTIEGGPQGRLFLKDNKVTSLQFITDRVPKSVDGLGINIKDTDIDVIISSKVMIYGK